MCNTIKLQVFDIGSLSFLYRVLFILHTYIYNRCYILEKGFCDCIFALPFEKRGKREHSQFPDFIQKTLLLIYEKPSLYFRNSLVSGGGSCFSPPSLPKNPKMQTNDKSNHSLFDLLDKL